MIRKIRKSGERPYYIEPGVELYHGDSLAVLPTFAAGRFSTIITDPPYGLNFMGRAWDHGIPSVPFWAEALRVCKPGATLMAFGGTRTFHRLTCAIEDAGWEIRDCLMWLHGQGFPKSLDISKAIDKAAGAIRDTGPIDPSRAGRLVNQVGKYTTECGWSAGNRCITKDLPATDSAKLWDGWGTALKPAHEDIIVAQKPHDLPGLCGILAQKIGASLCQLPSLVRAAESSSRSSLSEHVGDVGSALWTAVERCSTSADLFALMDTLPSSSTVPTSLSIAWSWLDTLAGLLAHESTFTTETKTSLTTDLRILNCSSSPITPDTIIAASIARRGTALSVSPVADIFSGVRARLRHTLGCSAPAPVTSLGLTSPPADPGLGLGPDYRPIIVAQKPLDGTFADNALRHGVAGLNINGARIGTDIISQHGRGNSPNRSMSGRNYAESAGRSWSGRWPANVVLDEAAAGFLDASVPATKDGVAGKRSGVVPIAFHKFGSQETQWGGYGGKGGPSRFFYTSKASRKDRGDGNDHPTVKPTNLIRWLLALTDTPTRGEVLDLFAGSGTLAVVASEMGRPCVCVEQDEHNVQIQVSRLQAKHKSK